MKKYWIIFGVIVAIIAGYWLYSSTNGTNGGDEVFTVKKQDLTEIISEIGKIVPVKKIDLTFPLTGTISQINVNEGQTIEKGDLLTKLDSSKIQADLANAQASVQEAQARLDKVYAGASYEDIKISETAVANARTNLDKIRLTADSEIQKAQSSIKTAEINLTNANNDLVDQQKENDENIKQAYEDAFTSFSNAKTKADTALKTIDYIQEKYFDSQRHDDQVIQKDEESADRAYEKLETPDSSDNAAIDSALIEIKTLLNDVSSLLAMIRENLETKAGINPTVTDEGYIDAEREQINTAISTISTAIQNISSVKINNEITINTATSDINTATASLEEAQANLRAVRSEWETRIADAEGNLLLAKDELAYKKAPPRQEDIALYRAQVNQAIAYVDLIQQNMADSSIKAPITGMITDIYTEVGELASLTSPVLSMIGLDQFQVESYISELDIARIRISVPVEIEIDAFGRDKFTGKIVQVNPYETIIDGDIFYKITAAFDEYNEAIKSGMTVDIEIKTADKEDVLVVPSRYIGEEGDTYYVKVLEREVGEEKITTLTEIEPGLKGTDMTEVVWGLEEGQKIIPYY